MHAVRMAAVTFLTGVLMAVLILLLGYPIAGAVYRSVVGYHPHGWEWIVPYSAYLLLAGLAQLWVSGSAFRVLVRARLMGDEKRAVPAGVIAKMLALALAQLALAVGLVSLAITFVWGPRWPAELQLVEFTACASQVEEGWSTGLVRAQYGRGPIRLVMRNRGSARVVEAWFTVEGAHGNYWRFALRDVAPGAIATATTEADFGNIVNPESHPSQPQHYIAQIMPGRIRLEGRDPAPRVGRPADATVAVDRCPP